jgi:hypothetical protein
LPDNLYLKSTDHRTENHSGNPSTEGQLHYSEHIVNFLKFLGSFGFGKVSTIFNFKLVTKKQGHGGPCLELAKIGK